jgi:hypothetical protein
VLSSFGGRRPGAPGGGGRVALPPALAAYLEDFAAERFFAAHEALEDLWRQRDGDPFLQGLILFAAAFVKVQRRSREGARRHFAGAARYLEPYLPSRWGIDVAAVVAHCRAALAALEAWPEDRPLPPDALGRVVPRFAFRLLPEEGPADRAALGDPGAVDLEAVVRQAIADRRAAGEPVGPASWAPLVKEVVRRLGGRVPRAAVRAAVEAALRQADG